MAFAAPVEQDSLAAAFLPELQQPFEGGSQRKGRASRLGHQHHRSFQHLGHMIGTGLGAFPRHSIVKAHSPFDERHTTALNSFLKQEACPVFRHKIQIHVVGLGPNDLAVEHRVDVIGAAFEGSRRKPSVHHDLQKGTGHGGFACAAARSSQHQAGNVISHRLHLPAHTPD